MTLNFQCHASNVRPEQNKNDTQCKFTGDQTGKNRPCRLRVLFAVRTCKDNFPFVLFAWPPALGVLNHLWVGGCGLGIGQDVSLPLIGRRWEARGQEVHQDVCVLQIGSEGNTVALWFCPLSLCKMWLVAISWEPGSGLGQSSTSCQYLTKACFKLAQNCWTGFSLAKLRINCFLVHLFNVKICYHL